MFKHSLENAAILNGYQILSKADC